MATSDKLSLSEPFETEHATDSFGSRSNYSAYSGSTAHAKPKMDIIVVIDLQSPVYLTERKKAFEEIKSSYPNITQIQFDRLNFGETNVLDQFYNADVAIIDLSIQVQQSSLFYHLGVRESFGMRQNILLFNEQSRESFTSLKSSIPGYSFITYKFASDNEVSVIITDCSYGILDPKATLTTKLKQCFSDFQSQSKKHMKEKFLADLRKIRDTKTGEDLEAALHNMRRRLDDPDLLSVDVVHHMLLNFRDIQNYDAMVKLVEDLKTVPNKRNHLNNPAIIHLYAFALNRRHWEGNLYWSSH